MYLLNCKTGEKIASEILPPSKSDLKSANKNFHFDWNEEARKAEVYKLVIKNDKFIHGFIGIIPEQDHLVLDLVELASINIGRNKLYERVAGNLIAFAGRIALDQFDGYMMMISKSELIEHYSNRYGFTQLRSTQKLISYPSNTKILVASYYEK